eukprot:11195700-Lingulodinium_polyedra.AAC.1
MGGPFHISGTGFRRPSRARARGLWRAFLAPSRSTRGRGGRDVFRTIDVYAVFEARHFQFAVGRASSLMDGVQLRYSC